MIATENLTKTYRLGRLNPFAKPQSSPALRGVTFRVAPGEIVAMVGRNGAGKTTLIKILSTLVLPDGGSATVGGMDVVSMAKQVRGGIGLVTGDERGFYWRLSGRDNLALFGALHNIPASELSDRVDETLESAGLAQHARLPVRAYSSGMKQRLSLARGLLHRPVALIMDEPCRSVDPLLQAEFISQIREQATGEPGRTVFLATHSLEEAVELGGKVALLERGRIEYFDRPGGASELKRLMSGFTTHRTHFFK